MTLIFFKRYLIIFYVCIFFFRTLEYLFSTLINRIKPPIEASPETIHIILGGPIKIFPRTIRHKEPHTRLLSSGPGAQRVNPCRPLIFYRGARALSK